MLKGKSKKEINNKGYKTEKEYDVDFLKKEKLDSESEYSETDQEMDEDINPKLKTMNNDIHQNTKSQFVFGEDAPFDPNREANMRSSDSESDVKEEVKVVKKGRANRKVKQNAERQLMPLTDKNYQSHYIKNKTFNDSYDEQLFKFQLNFLPESLPCRDDEKQVIEEFIISGLRNHGSSTSLYISGMPGTGKTATTLEVIKNLQATYKKKIKFIHMNGMQLNNVNIMYSLIYQQISGTKQKPATAAVMLDDYFKNQKLKSEDDIKTSVCHVLLVDELDALVTKKQSLLYNLFDWPSNKNSGLIILAIANTMDLPERFLIKIKSRIGEARLVYQPYNQSQIERIIKSRLTSANLLKSDAIKIVATKVSSLNGDIRRALQVCKRATEMAKIDYDKAKR